MGAHRPTLAKLADPARRFVARAARSTWTIAIAAAVAVAPERAAWAEGEIARGPVVDSIAVRFVTPETGGAGRPRFITEREAAFATRIEALNEQTVLPHGEYPDRFMRTAIDRFVARAMLASLMVQSGSEPPDLPRLAAEARSELEARVGAARLSAALVEEGITEAELMTWLFDEVRAAYYVDKAITPILSVTDDALREAYRSAAHPFRKEKFDDARAKLKRWIIAERLRAAATEFLQAARSRIRITSTHERPR